MEGIPTYQQVIDCKKLSFAKLVDEYKKLQKYKVLDNRNCFAGNPILYHYQLDNLCKVKTKNGDSFKDVMEDENKKNELWIKCNKYAKSSRPNNAPLRIFEIWRRMSGAIVFFKPTTAMYIYKKFNATAVLDPTAGWGGRMLAAAALHIKYTGIDTNVGLIDAYDEIMNLIDGPLKNRPENRQRRMKMIWNNALNVDFSQIEYDCVLTSPPYINLEMYENMIPFKDKENYYIDFLIPLIDKCLASIKNNGKVCINIDTKMYKDLMSYKYRECNESYDLKQQLIQGKNKGNKIYCWYNI